VYIYSCPWCSYRYAIAALFELNSLLRGARACVCVYVCVCVCVLCMVDWYEVGGSAVGGGERGRGGVIYVCMF
jgi:hypothetical protein